MSAAGADGPSQDWIDGYQAALDAIADAGILPVGIKVTWSKDPVLRAAAVARFEERVARLAAEKLERSS